MPPRLILLLLLLSSFCTASPEYRSWLTASQGEDSTRWSFSAHIGSSTQALDVSMPAYSFETDIPVLPVTPLESELAVAIFDLDTVENYIPPMLNRDGLSLEVPYFGLNLQLRLSRALVDYWSGENHFDKPIPSVILKDSQFLGEQLLTLRQHYQWNDWELMRLTHHLSLQLNDQIDIALFQWVLLKQLGYEIQLAKQNDHWFLLFASKQTSLNYASLSLGKTRYYVFPDNLMTTKPSHPINDLYSSLLDADVPLEVYYEADALLGERFNLMVSPKAYYGSNWSELILSYQGGDIRLPVSMTRLQALKSMPLLPLGDLLNQEMPAYQYSVLKTHIEKILSGFKLDQKQQWLQRLVHSNFSDQLPGTHESIADSLGVIAYKNKSYIRAYMLLHLFDMIGVDIIVAIETENSVFITQKSQGSTTSPVMVNSQFYIPIDMNDYPDALSESAGSIDSFDIIILN